MQTPLEPYVGTYTVPPTFTKERDDDYGDQPHIDPIDPNKYVRDDGGGYRRTRSS